MNVFFFEKYDVWITSSTNTETGKNIHIIDGVYGDLMREVDITRALGGASWRLTPLVTTNHDGDGAMYVYLYMYDTSEYVECNISGDDGVEIISKTHFFPTGTRFRDFYDFMENDIYIIAIENENMINVININSKVTYKISLRFENMIAFSGNLLIAKDDYSFHICMMIDDGDHHTFTIKADSFAIETFFPISITGKFVSRNPESGMISIFNLLFFEQLVAMMYCLTKKHSYSRIRDLLFFFARNTLANTRLR